MGVGHGFERGEGLRGDYEKRFFRDQVANRLREVRVVNVGDKTKGQSTIAVMLECFIGHYRAEVGATDTDVDNVADALSSVA